MNTTRLLALGAILLLPSCQYLKLGSHHRLEDNHPAMREISKPTKPPPTRADDSRLWLVQT